MPSIFLDPRQLVHADVTLSGDQAHYVSRVLRMGPGEELFLLDGEGGRYRASVRTVSRHSVVLTRGDRETPAVEPAVGVHLVQGIPKAEKMDWIVQKAVELGVAAVTPVVTERSDVRTTRKTDRWRRIAESAAAQCGRVRIPPVADPVSLRDFAAQLRIPGIVCWEGNGRRLRETLRELDGKRVTEIGVFVGPEGGFSGEEVHELAERGHEVVSLGPRVLRTETAAVAAVGITLYELGGLE